MSETSYLQCFLISGEWLKMPKWLTSFFVFPKLVDMVWVEEESFCSVGLHSYTDYKEENFFPKATTSSRLPTLYSKFCSPLSSIFLSWLSLFGLKRGFQRTNIFVISPCLSFSRKIHEIKELHGILLAKCYRIFIYLQSFDLFRDSLKNPTPHCVSLAYGMLPHL